MRATKPSQTYVAGGTTGPQGTPGGRARKQGTNGRKMIVGQEMYLWILILVEIAMIGGFRKFFRRFHGG
jgi:hypothetical protein